MIYSFEDYAREWEQTYAVMGLAGRRKLTEENVGLRAQTDAEMRKSYDGGR